MSMITNFLAIASLTMYGTLAYGSEFTPIPKSDSPDGTYQLRVVAPVKPAESSTLSVVTSGCGKSVGSDVLGSYAVYPLNAEPTNLGLLWSPDSHKIAMMVRDAKRSWTTYIYSISAEGLKPLKLPSATNEALRLLGNGPNFRVCREIPFKWSDADHIVVRASGDVEVDKRVIWYEIDVTYSLSTKTISGSKLVSTKPHEG